MRALIRLLLYPGLLLAGLWLLLATRFGLVMLVLTGEGATLGRLQVEDARGSVLEGVSFRQLRWSDGGQDIALGRTELDWRFARESGNWAWHLDRGRVSSVRLAGVASEDTETPESDAATALPEIALPLNLFIHALELGPVIADGATLIDSASVKADVVKDRVLIHQFRVQRPAESLRAQGELRLHGDWPLALELNAILEQPRQELWLEFSGSVAELKGQWRVQGWARGDGKLTAKPLRREASLTGVLNSGPLQQLDAGLGAAELAAQLDLSWQGSLQGEIALAAGSNQLQLTAGGDDIRVTLQAPQPAVVVPGLTGRMSVQGFWRGGMDGTLSADIDWRQLTLPDGKTGDLTASINGSVAAPTLVAALQHPDTALQLGAVLERAGDGGLLRLQQLQLQAPDDRVFRLQEPVSVSVQRDTMALPNLCLRADDGSGVCAAAQREDGVLTGRGTVERFPLALISPWTGPGLWHDAVVGGDWDLEADGIMSLRGWRLAHPRGDVRVDGKLGLGEPWPANLSLVAKLTQPQQTLTLQTRGSLRDLQASLTAQGHLAGSGDVQGNVLGRQLQLQADFASGPLSDLLPDFGSWAPALNVDLRLRQSAVDGRLKVRAGEDRADIRLSGGDIVFDLDLSDLSQILPGQTGAISGSGKLPLVSQSGPVLLELAVKDVVMPDGIPLAANIDLSGTVAKHQLSLDAQRQDARVQVALNGGLKKADWRGEIDTLTLGLTGGPEFTNQEPAALARVDGRVLLERLCLNGSAGGVLCAEAKNEAAAWVTHGNLSDLPLSLFGPWLNLPPWMQATLDGEWSLDSRRGGTAELRHSAFDIPPAGIRVFGSRVVLSGESLQALDVRTETKLQDGTVTGSLAMQQAAAGWQLQGKLSAPMLTWLQRPDIRVQLAPELNASWSSGQPLKLRGTVMAGEGAVNLDKLPASDGPTLSSDIVTRRQPRKTGLPLDVEVQVVLDKPLAITGYGFDGTTRGALRVKQTPLSPLTGNGTIIVAGRYKAWGQDLSISEGRIYFQNSPLAEPLIDVTAQRDVGSYKVGVQALGPARNPELTVTSMPVVNDSVALQMLVTGREPGAAASPTPDQAQLMQQALAALSVKGGNWFAENYGRNLPLDELRVEMDEEAGAPGLVLGRQIAPKLYIGYKVLLDSAVQAFQLRYTLNPYCDLTATSAQASEGRVGCRIER